MQLTQHPLSAAFPAMTPAEFTDLTRDIRINGQRHAIVLFEGMILDGWHRWQACTALSIKPKFIELHAGVDPVAYVQSLNLHRRHLTGSQRAAAVVACSEWSKSGDNQHSGGGEVASPPRTNDDMAKAADVSKKTIKQAKRAQEAGLGEAVRDGKVTAERAAELAKLPESERQAALETPPAPKPKPEPKAKTEVSPDVAALETRIAELETENQELKEANLELAQLMRDTMEDNASMRRALDGEDLLASWDKEVKRNIELVRVTIERANGIQNQNKALAKTAESWMRKFQKLEKKTKGLVEPDPEPVEENPYLDPSAPFDPMFDGPNPLIA